MKIDAAIREAELQRQAAEVQAEEVFVETRIPEETSMNTKKVFKGHVVNMQRLCQAIGDGKFSPNLVKPDDGMLNKLAQAMGGKNPPPGVMFEEGTTFSRKAK
jgi:hypothetical protein